MEEERTLSVSLRVAVVVREDLFIIHHILFLLRVILLRLVVVAQEIQVQTVQMVEIAFLEPLLRSVVVAARMGKEPPQ